MSDSAICFAAGFFGGLLAYIITALIRLHGYVRQLEATAAKLRDETHD